MNNLLFRLSVYLFVSFLVATTLFSQQLFLENGMPSHPNVQGYGSEIRSIIELSGDWKFSLDNGITWNTVKVPSAANYTGRIVYRRTFSVSESSVTNHLFTFVSYGMSHSSEVFVNETFVGKHEGGYTSFELRIPENVVQVGAENVIRVVVDNTLNYRNTFPTRSQVSGWKNYNGIIRDIFIEATPKLWIDDLNVTVEAIEPKAVKLLVTTKLSAKELQDLPQLAVKSFQLSAEITEVSSGVVIGKPVVVGVTPILNNEVTAQISISLPNAKLWSPDTPELYTVKVSLLAVEGKKDSVIDASSVSTGIRTFTKDKNILLFNGAPITLRGIVWIEDSERYGSAVTYEEMERDVALIKNLGANVVRIGFHPPHPFFLQLCDRYGLLAMVEIPNYEIPASVIEEEQYGTLVTNALKETIERNKYNPSVIAWGLGEGSGYDAEIASSILTQLHRTAKSMDDRLTYVVVRNPVEKASSVADIAAISFPPTNVKTFRSRLTAFKETNPKKPIIVAGYGMPTESGNRNGYSDPNSQEAQARYLQQRYAVMKDANIAGTLIFAFNDFRSDRPILTTKPILPDVHTSGLVEMGRQKKAGYDIIHSLYHDQKISALPIGTFVPNAPYVYVAIGLVLLIVAAWMLNSNRRFRESAWRAIFKSYNFFADIRDQFTIPLFHTTITAIIIAITFSVIFSSILHHFRTDAALDYILSHLFSDDLKRIIIRMCWDPILSVSYLTGVMVTWFLVLTVGIQTFALMARVKIRFFHSYSIAIWTASPWGFFIPVGMILYRVLESDPYVPWVLALVVFMCVWVYMRTLKGISVIYHIYTPKMYMIGLTVILVFIGALYAYIDYAFAFTAYADFFSVSILPFVH